MRASLPAALLLAAVPSSWLHAQPTLNRPMGEMRLYQRDSGLRANERDTRAVLFRDEVRIEGAVWLRIYFSAVELAPGSTLRLTALSDGAVQELDAAGLAQWGNTSAYFNGDAVAVELVGGPGTPRNRVVINHVATEIGGPLPIGSCGICGDDDRVQTNQNWTGRLLPGGCTAAVWNEQSCLVTAGHCVTEEGDVIEFEVPDSDPDCSVNHPPVEDQFPITESSFVDGGVGNDWAVLRTGTNNLGETVFERYGEFRAIAEEPVGDGQFLTTWGYGTDSECVKSNTQQSSGGNVMNVQTAYYTHDLDTTFGSSGSALIYHCISCDPVIVAVATHCACPNNVATRVDLPAFAAAREALCPGPCVTDINLDGVTNVLDLIELLLCFGQSAAPPCDQADVNADGTVNVLDLIELLLQFGVACP